MLGAPSLLHPLVSGSGFVHTDAAASSAWTIVESVADAEVDEMVRALTLAGAQPIAARFDAAASLGRTSA